MRKDIRCPICQKMVAKMDDDGTIHIRSGKRFPEVIAAGHVTIVCPGEILREMQLPIICGGITEIVGQEIFHHVSRQASTAA